MCGRYTTIESDKLYSRYGIRNRLKSNQPASYNMAPGQYTPIVLGSEQARLELMKWGFTPSWAKDSKIGYRLINARAESLLEKPIWSKAYRISRCLVPASGFYEWQKVGEKSRQPYYFHLPDLPIFSFAGLYSDWNDAEGVEHKTYSIITTKPNDDVASIHDRMPVILDPDEEAAWLDEANRPEDLQPLLNPYQKKMEIYAIDAAVNNPANNNPNLIKKK